MFITHSFSSTDVPGMKVREKVVPGSAGSLSEKFDCQMSLLWLIGR